MKKINKSILSISILMVVIAGCTKPKDGATGPAGATGGTGPNLTGNLQGVVFLYDVAGAKMLSSTLQAGDSVMLTNNSSGAVMKTTTSSTGTYMFNNISTGTYSLTVSKPGFGTVLSQGVQFAGGGNASRNYALSQIPTNSVTTATAVDTNYAAVGAGNIAENYVKIRGYVPVSAGGTTVIVFVSIPSLSSTSNAVGNFSTYYTTTLQPGVTSYKITIPTNSLYDLGFVSGNTVYFAAYIVGGNTSASSYVDWTSGQTVFTALSGAAVNTSAPVQ